MDDQLKKYLAVFKISWQENLAYRLNFFMWRLRAFIWIISSYFFWLAVFENRTAVGNYSALLMFTYLIGAFLLSEFVLSSQSVNVAPEISLGSLSNYLLKPINYFYFWLSRDLSNKLLILIASIFQLMLVISILKPPILVNLKLPNLLLLAFIIFIALVLNFYLNFFVSLLAFWLPEHQGWPQRFLFNVMLTFLFGLYFPFDILPSFIANILQYLPTGFVIYFPMQIYLGKINFVNQIIKTILMFFWLFVLIKINRLIWDKGLKKYASEGR